MISRSLLAGTALTAMLSLLGGVAVAAPIDLGGYSGPVTIKYSNDETFIGGLQTLPNGTVAPADGSQNVGIFTITSISGVGTPPNILDQSQYVYAGVFSGIVTSNVQPFTAAGSVGWTSTTTGGTFALYQIPIANFNAAMIQAEGTSGYTTGGCTGTFTCFNGITNVGGTEVLTWDISPPTTSPFYQLTNVLGQVVNTGANSGTAVITGGTDQGQFFPDLTITNDFCINNGTGTAVCGSGVLNAADTANNWAVLSNDPVTGVFIPEPASLLIFGSGILGLGLLRRRRRA